MNPREASPDPRDQDAHASQTMDPESGVSDDPRVDPTPDKRQSDTDGATREA
jgi:hypothetical protein